MRSKSKSKAKGRSEQTSMPASQPAGAPCSSSATATTISPVGATADSESMNQVEITYNHFVSLGMPTDVISLTEFGRIYCPSHSTMIDSTTIKSDSKSKETMSKAKSKDATVSAASTLTQALDFICTHLVGRQEVRKRRALISQCVLHIHIFTLCV